MLRISAVFAICVLTSGCISTGVYPDSWADKSEVKSGDCPDIDGEYENEGESFSKARNNGLELHAFSLADAFEVGFAANDEAMHANEKVRLELVDMRLRVTAIGPDGSIRSNELPVLRCRGSMMIMDANWTHSLQEEGGAELLGISFGMIHWFERTSWMLGRAEDGSLLMRTTSAGSLMFYWMSVLPGGESTWVRFPAVVPSSEQLAGVAP
jgi:hypothetical protein